MKAVPLNRLMALIMLKIPAVACESSTDFIQKIATQYAKDTSLLGRRLARKTLRNRIFLSLVFSLRSNWCIFRRIPFALAQFKFSLKTHMIILAPPSLNPRAQYRLNLRRLF